MDQIETENEMTVQIRSLYDDSIIDFKHQSSWSNQQEIVLYLTNFTIMGEEHENLTIQFSSRFKNQNKAPLLNSLVWGYPLKITISNPTIEKGANYLKQAILYTLLAFVFINSMIGSSSAVLWAMMNTL